MSNFSTTILHPFASGEQALRQHFFRQEPNFGRQAPKPIPAGAKYLSDYLTTPLSAAPAAVKVPSVPNWGELGNAALGDCVGAMIGHAEQAATRVLTGKILNVTTLKNQIINWYHWYEKKYDNGQDNGCVITTALGDWKNMTIGAGKSPMWARIDYTNAAEVKQVIASFGVACIGVNFPQSAMNQFNAKAKPIWSVITGPTATQYIGGHALAVVGYDGTYWYVISWGTVVRVTNEWLLTYCDEAYTVILPEVVSAGKYNNINLASLEADMPSLAA